ncbi:MAG: HsdR family type I site-specific deoxyribonuclease [Pseudomonadota bacterium]|nr:HsdR family type I site-specific deoxyribonuclease [Pseudomonadota bacterium]
MSEYLLAEKPCVDELMALGWKWLKPKDNELARDGLNQVILRDECLSAIQRINGVDEETARAVYSDLLHIHDNEQFTKVLRGDYSRTVPSQRDKKTIHLIDFRNTANNRFTVTNQLYVQAQKNRIPDVVLYVNGIPLVVIEAKSPLTGKDKSGEAFDQIKQYERDIPRLFYSNLFNIVTDGVQLLYGATGAPSDFWGVWKDAWPMQDADFSNALAKGLYCLCEPSRLLEMLAHFVVFEVEPDTGASIKKICRYQQYRAVNKIFDRVIGGKGKKGLIWHTQGSGKSLTMVYATLKLKAHLTSSAAFNPNILVLTDRIDLDDQISTTFIACGLPNPTQAESLTKLQGTLRQNTHGLVLLSTIFKFEGSKKPVTDSGNWIVLVDECHRTQEKDLGAYLRATLPDACFFGFTGTPVKKNDRDTYTNFSEGTEGYLDKYGIDDAVADGATVPIRYTGRKTEWQIDPQKLDVLFDQWFAHEPEAVIERLKQRGITIAELAKHPKRVELIAYDIWTHFHEYIQPDGLKAQIVGIDREAVILYKQALDKVITEHFIQQGLPEGEAIAKASAMSACVYSSSQEDDKPSEDTYLNDVRKELQKHKLEKQEEKDIKGNFKDKNHPLSFLIVCNKLLTGFDAPIEAVMYLDNPLKEHSLLQAIARTNRVYGKNKQFGLIVDYIGITKKLDEALETYRSEDVAHALQDLDMQRAELKAAFTELKTYLRGIARAEGAAKLELKKEYDALVQALGAEDAWYSFRRKAKIFIRCYEALSPDPSVLDYAHDLRWVAGFIHYGTQVFEQKESLELGDYSEKIRNMLCQHLDVTGISTICKIRNITDPDFWQDFETAAKPEDEIRTAAIRKGTEMKKVMVQKMAENPLRYAPFSEKVMEVLKRFQQGQLDAANTLKEYENIANELNAEEQSYKDSGLDQRAYGVLKLLGVFDRNGGDTLKQLARDIDALYISDQTAPKGWQSREQLRKDLRQQVREQAHGAGIAAFKDVPAPVEEYALKHYAKVA